MREQTINKIKLAEKEYILGNISLNEVCIKHKTDKFTFANYLRSKGISCRRKVFFDDTLFEDIDNEEKAYWLGFLFADGNITYDLDKTKYKIELGLATIDYNHLEKYKTFLKYNKDIKFRSSTNSCRIIVGSKKACEDLIKLGCTPKKSLILKFPKNIREDLLSHFIRGYFDGDGSISICKNTNRLKTICILGTLNFLKRINNI